MCNNIDVTNKIERLEHFEERLGVTLECLSSYSGPYDDESRVFVKVNGELHPNEGVLLKSTIALCVVVYNTEDRILESDTCWIYKDDFYGLEVFSFYLILPPGEISKIRIYPKKG